VGKGKREESVGASRRGHPIASLTILSRSGEKSKGEGERNTASSFHFSETERETGEKGGGEREPTVSPLSALPHEKRSSRGRGEEKLRNFLPWGGIWDGCEKKKFACNPPLALGGEGGEEFLQFRGRFEKRGRKGEGSISSFAFR